MNKKILFVATLIAAVGFGCKTTQNTDSVRDPAGKCDPGGFVARIKKKGCYMSGNDERRITHNAEYCKQLANRFEIVSMERSGDVVVLDTNDCSRVKYEVDASGVNEIKIIQDYAYMTSNDGQLYIYSSHSKNFYELRSNGGNSYSRANKSNVIEIKGADGGRKAVSTHANGAVQEWDSEKINSMDSKRLRLLTFWTYGSNGSVYND